MGPLPSQDRMCMHMMAVALHGTNSHIIDRVNNSEQSDIGVTIIHLKARPFL